MSQNYKNLATPMKIGSLEIKNRIWFSSVWSRMATADGEISDRQIDHYAARARGGAGLIIQEGTAVDGRHVWKEPEIRIDNDRFCPGLHRLVETVHRYNVPIICQLHCAGMFGVDPISPSGVPAYDFGMGSFIEPKILSSSEVEEMKDLFITGAVRAQGVGYDGVELHGGAAYLLEQFFSPHNNIRTDRYGGSLEKRMQLAKEILRGIRKKCGPDFVVGYTNPDTDAIVGGITSEDSIAFALAMEQEGISYWDLVIPGTYETFHFDEIEGVVRKQKRGQFDRSARYVKALNIPVSARCCSSIDFDVWDEAVETGLVDGVRAGRALLADPDLAGKVLGGRPEDVRKCLTCNECLESGVFKTWGLNCAINYGLGRSEKTNMVRQRVAVPKNVLVIGGGPGGLEAARVAGQRGHKVTLMEKEAQLGGAMKLAGLTMDKKALHDFIDWLSMECSKFDVVIHRNTEATVQTVQDVNPDVVILSNGAVPVKPPIPGIDKSHVVFAADVLTGKASLGKKVVIAGAGAVGIEVAEFTVKKGLATDVSIIDMIPFEKFGHGLPHIDLAYWFRTVFPRLGLKVGAEMKIEEIGDKSVKIVDNKWKRHEFEADTVILALGYTPDMALYEALKGKVEELYVIGDAVKARNIMDAVHDGAYFGQLI
ncbi:FAD-dependent oxidoreductase [Desulfobacter sp.]|uniref:oxidoreductase n=1 Tax=Desulfobacter sp. TaxID=2294 RepID=UPI003D0C21E8